MYNAGESLKWLGNKKKNRKTMDGDICYDIGVDVRNY